MAQGTVKWFNSVKGYGFISPDDGSKDKYVHLSAVKSAGLSDLQEGQKVEYDLGEVGDIFDGKAAAENLVLLD